LPRFYRSSCNDRTDALIILVIVIVSGFWILQERGAANAVEKLLAMVSDPRDCPPEQ